MVLVLSSAARMPLPGATSARAISARSDTASGYSSRRRYAAMGGEELAQERLALGAPHAEPPLWMVIQLRLVEQLRDRDNGSGFVIGRAEHHERHAREHDRAGAHRAGLDRDIDGRVGETPASERRARRAKRDHLGVCGGIVFDLA